MRVALVGLGLSLLLLEAGCITMASFRGEPDFALNAGLDLACGVSAGLLGGAVDEGSEIPILLASVAVIYLANDLFWYWIVT